MSKIAKVWLSLFLFFFASVHGEPLGFVSLKPSYFYPQDSTFRHLYKGGFLPLAEVGFMLKERVFLSAEGGCFYSRHRIRSFDIYHYSFVMLVPCSLYLGYLFAKGDEWNLYLKIGPNEVYTKTRIHIPNLPTNTVKWTFGGSVGAGSRIMWKNRAFVELFCNYLFDRKNIFSRGSHFFIDLGGLQIGAAIGSNF
jgi:hypothetical protein